MYFTGTVLASALFFSATNPTHILSLWLMLGFLLLVGLLYWLICGLVALLGVYAKPIAANHRRLERALTLLGALLIAMQSAGQLTLKDVAVLLPLVLLAYLYVSYTKRVAPNR